MTVTLEVLHVPDCPNLPPLLQRLQQVTELAVAIREIRTTADAEAAGMAGSPTLLVNGRDPFSPADGTAYECGVACRIYRDERGRPVPIPSIAQLRAVLAADGPIGSWGPEPAPGSSSAERPASSDCVSCEPGHPDAVLSAWRSRALPLDPVEKAGHQAVLHSFATTGRAPTTSQLAPVVADSGRAVDEVLGALHELDAIRLAPDGQVAVVYPFSAQPTRHRVRIDDRVDVYAMCAIDALGMSAMLGADTRIESVDVTSGQPVTITMLAAGEASWDPAAAVVLIAADAGGGPSADCCCDYLNFFTDQASAMAWTVAHPHVPGQILTQAEAEQLGAKLFGSLLATDGQPNPHDHQRLNGLAKAQCRPGLAFGRKSAMSSPTTIAPAAIRNDRRKPSMLGTATPFTSFAVLARTVPTAALAIEAPTERIRVLRPPAAPVSDAGTAPTIRAGGEE